MYLLLDGQQVDQRLVNDRVGPVALTVQQAAKGVLHGAGHGGKDVGFHGGQVHDVLAGENLRYLDALRVNIVQHQHFSPGLVTHPGLGGRVQVDGTQVVLVLDGLVAVVDFPLEGVDDDGAIVSGNEVGVAHVVQGADDALQLPGRGGATPDTSAARRC